MRTVDEVFKQLPPGWRIQVHDHTVTPVTDKIILQ
jgi:hypothetical protein